jgi:5'-phosphate synthase pdxT subunit
MGTCAGLILLSKNCGDNRVAPLGVLPVTVARNGWGRQTESFIEKLDLNPEAGFKKNTAPFEAVFIRAPRILSIGPEVRILASVSGRNGAAEPVMVAWKNILGLTFHPELAVDDARIHEWFLSGF